jgi:hypothetical protein
MQMPSDPTPTTAREVLSAELRKTGVFEWKAQERQNKINARDAIQRVLDDPRPWHEVAKGWTREQFVTRLAEHDAELKERQ